jgi:ADP-heptose:LPS heptosyltransferase
MKRALLVELLGGIGDLVFILPALDRLRVTHPNLEWDVFAFLPGCELLAGDPRVARVIEATRPLDDGSSSKVRVGHLEFRNQLASLLTEQSYDLVVSDTRHSGIPDVIEESAVPRAVTQLWTGATPAEPVPQLFLRRLREEGLIADDSTPARANLVLTPFERNAARAVWRELGLRPEQVIVLNRNAGLRIKRWSPDAWTELSQRLRADGYDVVSVATHPGIDAAAVSDETMGHHQLPRLTLRLTAACLENVACLISGDTGLAHVASAVGAPVVALYGPTWAGRYGTMGRSVNVQSTFACPERNPLNFTLQRCWAADRCVMPGKRSCCDDVSVEAVLDGVAKIARIGQFGAPGGGASAADLLSSWGDDGAGRQLVEASGRD